MNPNSSKTSLTVTKDLGVINREKNHNDIFLRIIYILNILITFWLGSVTLFTTEKAHLLVFQ